MTEYTIDPLTWYTNRNLDRCPKHFVVAEAPLTEESKQWILDKLTGRFAIVNNVTNLSTLIILDSIMGKVAFEDPKEALIYELTWS